MSLAARAWTSRESRPSEAKVAAGGGGAAAAASRATSSSERGLTRGCCGARGAPYWLADRRREGRWPGVPRRSEDTRGRLELCGMQETPSVVRGSHARQTSTVNGWSQPDGSNGDRRAARPRSDGEDRRLTCKAISRD